MSDFVRQRLEAKIAEAISTLIMKGEIKSPELSTLVSVSRVELAPGNGSATIYISSVLDDASLNQSVEALRRAGGFIQKRVGAFLKTRNTPVLTFKVDHSLKDGHKINTLIDSLMNDEHGK